MNWSFTFFFNSILLGVGLAMDAFSVSLANGLHAPCMGKGRMCMIGGLFAFFQGLMPMIGWICIHTIVQYFSAFQKLIPWIALALLGFIGGKMLYESIKCEGEDCNCGKLTLSALLMQGIATSIVAVRWLYHCRIRPAHGACCSADHCRCHLPHLLCGSRHR